jgi:hypothetical protein
MWLFFRLHDDSGVSRLAILGLYGCNRIISKIVSHEKGGKEIGRPVRRLRRVEPYRKEGSGAKARAPIKPVIVAQLINFDALPVCRLMRHRVCHHQRLGGVLRWYIVVLQEKLGCRIEMVLEYDIGIYLAEDRERSHVWREKS